MRRELTARVGSDGVLNLTVRLGPEDANKTVRIVVESATGSAMSQEEWEAFVTSMAGRITDPTYVRQTELVRSPATSQEEWDQFIARTAGRWQGDFIREQGEYQEREPL